MPVNVVHKTCMILLNKRSVRVRVFLFRVFAVYRNVFRNISHNTYYI